MIAYNPAEVERLIAATRKRYVAPGVAWIGEALDMADQLEAARAEVDRLTTERDGFHAQLEIELQLGMDASLEVVEQVSRVAALESELATLRASVVAAMSSAGPEVAEDERAG